MNNSTFGPAVIASATARAESANVSATDARNNGDADRARSYDHDARTFGALAALVTAIPGAGDTLVARLSDTLDADSAVRAFGRLAVKARDKALAIIRAETEGRACEDRYVRVCGSMLLDGSANYGDRERARVWTDRTRALGMGHGGFGCNASTLGAQLPQVTMILRAFGIISAVRNGAGLDWHVTDADALAAIAGATLADEGDAA